MAKLPVATAPSVGASKSITASRPVTGQGKLVPAIKAAGKKVTTPAPKKPTTTPPKDSSKPKDTTKSDEVKKLLQMGVDEQLQINALEGQLESQKALRKYQEDSARLDLQASLKTLDRNALDLYKGVADNYAGRGMLRSGGYATADDKAKTAVIEEKASLNKAMTDLERTNQLENLSGQETVDSQVSAIKSGGASAQVQELLNQIANSQNTTGATPPKKKPKKKKK